MMICDNQLIGNNKNWVAKYLYDDDDVSRFAAQKISKSEFSKEWEIRQRLE
jgi:hypothetical protein